MRKDILERLKMKSPKDEKREIQNIFRNVAGDVIWSGYNAHNTSNRSEVLQDRKFKELTQAILNYIEENYEPKER
jgi:hypothetical protein